MKQRPMTESTKLDEPLSDADYDELEGFLGSNAVPQDCMDLEMLDGFLTAIVSGPERILSLVLRLQQSIRRTLAESPTRFKPLLYHAEPGGKDDRNPPEASAWCEGYMTGVLLREAEWEPLYAEDASRDWMLPIEALAYGDHDPEYLDWVDTEEKRLGMIDELPIAAVLISRFWQERNRTDTPNRAERRAQRREASRKGRQRLH